MNINMINIKKNHFDEEYKSDISSDSKDEPILYMKKSITNKNNIKTRSASVDNEIIKKDMIKNLHKSVNNYSYSKSLAINNLKKSNIENERNLNNINFAGKTFQTFFFNPTSDNKQKHSNNINNINKRFNSSNVLFNNYRGIDPKKIGEDKNNFYAVKRPLDKQKQIFKKRQPTEELKPIIIKENNDKNLLRNISFKEEEEKTITINNTENTILDENEELIGRNIPH
jgi:hypothetical protein